MGALVRLPVAPGAQSPRSLGGTEHAAHLLNHLNGTDFAPGKRYADVPSLVPLNVTLFGNRIDADIIS